jgi:hypothetical protein
MASPRRMGSPEAKNRAALLDAAEQIMLEEGYPAASSRRRGRRFHRRPAQFHHRRTERRHRRCLPVRRHRRTASRRRMSGAT